MEDPLQSQSEEIKSFYESVYYRSAAEGDKPARYHFRLARRLGVGRGDQVLDVACGLGGWLNVCQQRGATPHGVDISEKAIQICKQTMPHGLFFAQPAERLPFPDDRFDFVTCLGSLEHFVDPLRAVQEMARTSKSGATLLIVVPNSDFIARRFGRFQGTQQTAAKEEPRTPHGWARLFGAAGLKVVDTWPDLHMLSWHWITQRGLARVPQRLAVALGIVLIPLRWQYQITFLCRPQPAVEEIARPRPSMG